VKIDAHGFIELIMLPRGAARPIPEAVADLIREHGDDAAKVAMARVREHNPPCPTDAQLAMSWYWVNVAQACTRLLNAKPTTLN
jgi:hypothetical protein